MLLKFTTKIMTALNDNLPQITGFWLNRTFWL